MIRIPITSILLSITIGNVTHYRHVLDISDDDSSSALGYKKGDPNSAKPPIWSSRLYVTTGCKLS